jgi:medium-chain acyl-[acyl-carrier-protein] hydrolase
VDGRRRDVVTAQLGAAAGRAPSPWTRIVRPRPAARLRLICLPWAGGGASGYRDWPAHLPDDVEVVAVQLPGRESRLGEPPVTSMEPLVAGLAAGVRGQLDRPFALFGHSMGALIAFELARRLRSMGREPVRLLVSGARPPHLPSRRARDRHTLPDQEFVATVRELGGMPPEVLDSPDLLDLVLPALRGDFALVEGYAWRAGPALHCPISAFGGVEDDEVGRDDLAAWSRHTTGSFRRHLLPGGHFFVNSSRESLLQIVAAEVDGGEW